ncbi:MAG: hypothetical protein IKA71_01955 [Lentisphaeria bacterium]|nr:hypothetical protein [Lentisphaeria bacterium]
MTFDFVVKKKIFPLQLFFLSGLCWGGIFINELLSYPELWFFVYCAAGAGCGYLLSRLLPEWLRTPAELILLSITALMRDADIYSALVPAVFGMSCANTLCRAADEWYISRQLCGGILLGAVLNILIPQKIFIAGLIGCTGMGLPVKWGRFAAVVLALAVLYMQPGFRKKNELPELWHGAVITALSMTEPAGIEPRVILTGDNELKMRTGAAEIFAAGKVICAGNLSGVREKADLIFAGTLSPISDGGVWQLTELLLPGGLLVIPVEMTGVLPEWHWYILPGSNGKLAIGRAEKELQFDTDKMDAAFISFFPDDYEGKPLAGALSGMLTGEKLQPVKILTPWRNDRRMIWGGVCILMLVILGGYIFYRRMSRPHGEYVRIMLNCGGYAFMAAAFLPMLCVKMNLPFIPQLFVVLSVIWFFRRPAENRRKWSRVQGLISVLALLLMPVFGWWLLAAALFCGGYACAQLDNELRAGEYPVEPLRFMAIALGVSAVWLMHVLAVPELQVILIAAAVRFYSWFRN